MVNYLLCSVLSYLQPYLIYIDDISFKQYEEIKEYIDEQIIDYKKTFVSQSHIFNKLNSFKYDFKYESIFNKLLQGRKDECTLVLENYGLNTHGKLYRGQLPIQMLLSTSEIIKYMNQIDYTSF